MPAADVLRIMVTTGVVQFLCDVAAYFFVYSQPAYQDAMDRAVRAQTTVQFWKQKASTQSNKSKTAKSIEQAEEDAAERVAVTTKFHVWPQLWLAVIFLGLTRILGTELGGNVAALLPFTPPSLLRRWFTARGLEWDDHLSFTAATETAVVTDVGQACSWTLIYVLSGLSIKYYVNKLFGTRSQIGGNILMTMADTKAGKKMLKNAGVDPNTIKELKGE